MKKIYLMGLTAMFALAVNAQTTVRIKNSAARPSNVKGSTGATLKNGTPNSVQQVTGSLVCNSIYVAGTTMDLVFKFTQTVNNDEYIDMFSITFPAGITPTGLANTSDPFPSAGPGQPVATAALNPISGQTISWGSAIQSQWGAIHTALGVGQTFTVNVTIAPGLVGAQVANFTATGDTYTTTGNPTSGDLNGTVTINDTPFSNIFAKLVQPSGITGLHNCGMTASHTVIARYINEGTATESNIPLNYSINGVAGTLGMYPGPLVPGDSITIGLGIGNFSASDVYSLKAWSEVVGDIDLNNDTAFLDISNSISTPLTSSNYTNMIETVYEQGSINNTAVAGSYPFTVSNFAPNSGTYSLERYIPAGAVANGTYTSVSILPCMDVVSGEQYKISYWKNVEPGANGQTAITTGTANTVAGTATVLKAYATITPGTWVKDSVIYTAAATGTRYFAIRGKGVVSATATMDIYVDDIMIEKVALPTGIKSMSSELVSIFPNPTSGILNVNAVEANSSLEVFNVVGDKVYSNVLVKGTNSLDLSGLANGAYFVKLNSNGQVTTKKVVLSK